MKSSTFEPGLNDLSEKHSKGFKKVKSVCCDWYILIYFVFVYSFCYSNCRSDDWVLNFRIALNSVFNIRKAFILYFINGIKKLQQRN